MLKIYWLRNEARDDGHLYDQLCLETKRSICILFEKRSKR